jgi:thioesterase domain-containing protein
MLPQPPIEHDLGGTAWARRWQAGNVAHSESARVAAIRARPVRAVGFEPLPAPAGGLRRSIVPIKPDGSSPPLFMFGGAAGEVFSFKRLAERIRGDIRVYGLEGPGLYADRPTIDNRDDLVSHYVAEIEDVWPEGLCLVGGFSFGAMIGLEVARRLDEQGRETELLLFDYGPDWAPRRTAWYEPVVRPFRVAAFHWRNYRGLEGQRRSGYRRELFRSETQRMARRLHLAQEGAGYRMALRVGRRRPPGYAAMHTSSRKVRADWDWTSHPYQRHITLLRCDISLPAATPNETLGFDERSAPGGITVRRVPGHHAFMFVEPHIFTVLVEVEDWVDRVAPAGHAAVEGSVDRGEAAPSEAVSPA